MEKDAGLPDVSKIVAQVPGAIKEVAPNVYNLNKVIPHHKKMLQLAMSPHGKIRKSGYIEPKKIDLYMALKGIVHDRTIHGAFGDIGKHILNVIAPPGTPPLL